MKIGTKHFKKWWELNGARFCETRNLEKLLSVLFKEIAKKAYCDGLHEGVKLVCDAKNKSL